MHHARLLCGCQASELCSLCLHDRHFTNWVDAPALSIDFLRAPQHQAFLFLLWCCLFLLVALRLFLSPVNSKTFQPLNPFPLESLFSRCLFSLGDIFYVQNFNDSFMRPHALKSNSKVSWKLIGWSSLFLVSLGIVKTYIPLPSASVLLKIIIASVSIYLLLVYPLGVTAVQRIYVAVTFWLLVSDRAVVWIQFLEPKVCITFAELVFHLLITRKFCYFIVLHNIFLKAGKVKRYLALII